jgi:hypothetical protein
MTQYETGHINTDSGEKLADSKTLTNAIFHVLEVSMVWDEAHAKNELRNREVELSAMGAWSGRDQVPFTD